MNTILIRAEDKNEWERRTPLVPDDLKDILQNEKTRAFVETSPKRVFKEEEYAEIGAEICSDMEPGQVILGVKEIPREKILNNRTYLFFSHTIKGQKENMPMLQRLMDSGSTLIDYEKITDKQGRRLVYFGPFAGDAGALDILWLVGEYWQYKGIHTPFAECKQATEYDSVADAKEKLSAIGEQIRAEGLPSTISPLVIGIMGYGNVSKGAQNIFNTLPVQYLQPEDLAGLEQNGNTNNKTVYVVVFKEEHMVRRSDGQPFDLQDYYTHPEKYESVFEQYLPYITILVNATYWDKRYPRFVTWDGLKRLYDDTNEPKLCAIADITCDVNGSIECNVKSTDTGMPAYLVEPPTESITDGHKGEGIVLLAVDNLPAELPRDASAFFSNQLKPFVPSLIRADFSKPLKQSGLDEALQRAVIVYNGRLTEDFAYIKQYLEPIK